MKKENSLALLDHTFLKKLDEYRNKKILVKIVALNWDEESVAEITSNIVSGNISVDGSSTIRRTCNLSLVTNSKVDQINWSLNTKFYVYIGVYNDINTSYEPIIWFPQGLFIITSFSATLNAQGYTINISGKDKMCLLNGDVSGQLFAAHEFSTVYTYHKDGSISKTYIPIHEIIREAIHTYGQESYDNIIINDLDTCGVELVDYTGNDSILYIFRQYTDDQVVGSLSGEGVANYAVGSGGNIYKQPQNLPYPSFKGYGSTQIAFEKASGALPALFETACVDQGKTYNLAPFHYGYAYYELIKRIEPTDANTTAGYRATDLTYPGELMVSIGGKVTEVLDKIIKMLGEFEYFYDVDGRFIFQRKRIYFNSSWSNAIVNDNETYYDSVANGSNVTYDFLDGYLIESFQNKPQLNVIKNDFAIWGAIKGVGNKKLPVHLRYAIDNKPQAYYSLLDQKLYVANDAVFNTPDGNLIVDVGGYDWRELIYQMARDNLAANNRLNGLQAALVTLTSLHAAELDPNSMPDSAENYAASAKYHYDYKKLSVADYAQYYKWDDINSEFVLLESEEEFYSCKAANEFLYGPNKDLQHLELSAQEIEDMNRTLGYDYRVASEIDDQEEQEDQWVLDRAATLELSYGETLIEIYDWMQWWYNYYDVGPGSENIDFDSPHYNLQGGHPYYTPQRMSASQMGTISLATMRDVNHGKRWTEFAQDYLNFRNGYTFAFENFDMYANREPPVWDSNLQMHMCFTREAGFSLRQEFQNIIDILESMAIMYNLNDHHSYRSYDAERDLLQQYANRSGIKIMQDEISAWEDTFNTGYDAYYADMLGFWPQLYRTKPTVQTIYNDDGSIDATEDGVPRYTEDTAIDWMQWSANGYWNPYYVTYNWRTKEISFNEPESMFFWIDFFDAESDNPELFQYAVPIIGRRAKAVNDDKVTGIYFRDTPDLLFVSTDYKPVAGEENLAYARINLVPPISDYFAISAQGKSAKEVLDTMVYESTYYQESVTISSIPIYYLEPNTRIAIHDELSGIDGNYLIKQFSLQLQHDGMMSITATRAVDRII